MRTGQTAVLAVAAMIASTGFGSSSSKLTPDEIKTTFFNGNKFTAATPSGVTFDMVFSRDGKVVRQPTGNGGAKGEGTWKLTKEGFCTTWKGAKANCFRVLTAGDNKWSVMKGTTVVATWSK
jgi:hypothetical protein